MCVIAVGKKKNFQADWFEACCAKNPDGFFVLRVETGQSIRTMKVDEARKFFSDTNKNYTVVLHARVKSVGEVTLSNVHGWKRAGVVFCHNGTLNVKARDKLTDSQTFFEDVFIPIFKANKRRFNTTVVRAINACIGSSRFCFVNGKDIRLYGEFKKKGNCFFSNLFWDTSLLSASNGASYAKTGKSSNGYYGGFGYGSWYDRYDQYDQYYDSYYLKKRDKENENKSLFSPSKNTFLNLLSVIPAPSLLDDVDKTLRRVTPLVNKGEVDKFSLIRILNLALRSTSLRSYNTRLARRCPMFRTDVEYPEEFHNLFLFFEALSTNNALRDSAESVYRYVMKDRPKGGDIKHIGQIFYFAKEGEKYDLEKNLYRAKSSLLYKDYDKVVCDWAQKGNVKQVEQWVMSYTRTVLRAIAPYIKFSELRAIFYTASVLIELGHSYVVVMAINDLVDGLNGCYSGVMVNDLLVSLTDTYYGNTAPSVGVFWGMASTVSEIGLFGLYGVVDEMVRELTDNSDGYKSNTEEDEVYDMFKDLNDRSNKKGGLSDWQPAKDPQPLPLAKADC